MIICVGYAETRHSSMCARSLSPSTSSGTHLEFKNATTEGSCIVVRCIILQGTHDSVWMLMKSGFSSFIASRAAVRKSGRHWTPTGPAARTEPADAITTIPLIKINWRILALLASDSDETGPMGRGRLRRSSPGASQGVLIELHRGPD